MAHDRRLRILQTGLFGLSDQLKRLSGSGDPLETMARVVDFESTFAESFNGRLRDECLNAHWFLSLADARAKIEA